jgi:ribosome-associated toxin RatA of RatAB toxin-antitoxin module
MTRTTSDIVIDASADSIMDVIADFAAYPQWATGVKSTDVVREGASGRAAAVRFVLDAPPIRDEYELEYVWDLNRSVAWTLSKAGSMLKSMDGAYILDEQGPGRTKVTYQLAVDVSIPLLGMLKRKAEKVIIDTALKGLKKRVERP